MQSPTFLRFSGSGGSWWLGGRAAWWRPGTWEPCEAKDSTDVYRAGELMTIAIGDQHVSSGPAMGTCAGCPALSLPHPPSPRLSLSHPSHTPTNISPFVHLSLHSYRPLPLPLPSIAARLQPPCTYPMLHILSYLSWRLPRYVITPFYPSDSTQRQF